MGRVEVVESPSHQRVDNLRSKLRQMRTQLEMNQSNRSLGSPESTPAISPKSIGLPMPPSSPSSPSSGTANAFNDWLASQGFDKYSVDLHRQGIRSVEQLGSL